MMNSQRQRGGIILKLIGAIVVLAVLAVIGTVVFFSNKDEVLRSGAEKALRAVYQVDVKVEGAQFNVVSGSGKLTGVTIGNPTGYDSAQAATFGSIEVDVDPRSLTTEVPVIHLLRFTEPNLTLEMNGKESNLGTLSNNAGRLSDPARKVTDMRLKVERLEIESTTIGVAIPRLRGQTIKVPLRDIVLTDIGGEDGTVTQTELARLIFDALLAQTAQDGSELLPKESLGNLEDQAGSLLDSVTGAIDGIRGALDGLKGSKGQP